MSRKEALHRYNCSEKGKAAQRRYRRTSAGKALSRRAKLKYYYRLAEQDYLALFIKQEGRCAICNRHQSQFVNRLYVDHDHATGKVRGLLCNSCNRHLGRFQSGREYKHGLVQKMEEYLRRAS